MARRWVCEKFVLGDGLFVRGHELVLGDNVFAPRSVVLEFCRLLREANSCCPLLTSLVGDMIRFWPHVLAGSWDQSLTYGFDRSRTLRSAFGVSNSFRVRRWRKSPLFRRGVGERVPWELSVVFGVTEVTLIRSFEEWCWDGVEKSVPMKEINCSSNFGTFKSITSFVCSWLSQIGDDSLVFQMLEDVVVDQIFLKAPVDNICALLRMLITVDAIPTRLSERSIITLANSLPEYLINVVSCVAEDHNDCTGFTVTNKRRYYLLPCLFLFYRSNKLLSLVLNVMGSLVGGYGSSNSACPQYATEQPSRIRAIVSILLLMHADSKMQQRLLLNKEEIDRVLQNILVLQVMSLSESSEETNMTIESRHRVQCAFDQLKVAASKLFSGMLIT
ncbi:hypothetical protein RJ639_028294 [Escallonia herrerae]|uniref:Uncharacterized protein n=1 Tax=Escallonia herrerae TaxID=1293975 RepID=A0AA88XJH4_9ASTE|nr:hypothetical protein RJ639_028294 [Escallonia herrerae]